MMVSRVEALTLIEPHFEQDLLKESYEIKNIPAINLLTHLRFDLAFKLLYLDMLEKHVSFSTKAYKEHIRAFSLGKYNEPGNQSKNSIERFYEEFKNIYEDIASNGFDSSKTLIPLSKNGTILNGAHRVASAIKTVKNVSCINLDIACPNYNYKFFYNRSVPTEMLDAAAVKFVEYADNIYIACLWPTAQGYDNEIEEVIPNIVYRKDIALNYNGAHNFISQVYMGEPWLGSVKNNFQGAKGKLVECFKQQGPVRIVAFQADSLDTVLKVKEDIRQLFNVGKHSIHITDTKEEAVNTARLVFNDNSIHFLNYAKPNSFLDFHQKVSEVKSFLLSNKITDDNFILDGSMVLAAYGLRPAKDVDYFVLENTRIVKPLEGFDPHDSELKFHKKVKNELIYNPANYFHFQNIKFISLQQLYSMKINRAEEKDLNDCRHMQAFIDSNKIQKKINQIKQSIFYTNIMVKTKTIEILKITGLFKPTRVIYRLFRSIK